MNNIEKFEIRISSYGKNSSVVVIKRFSDDKRNILFFNNCDAINGTIYFLIMSNLNKKIQIDLACDNDFWSDFVKLHNEHNKKNTELIFTKKSEKILNQKIKDHNVFFTGGKDSVLTLLLVNKNKIIPNVTIFESQISNYSLEHLHKNKFITKEVEFFSSNIDNELFYTVEDYESDLVILLPILSKYAYNYLGVNSDDLLYDYIFDFYDYEKLFLKHKLKLTSPIVSLRPSSVLAYCEKEELSFTKCGGDDYCYLCTECYSTFFDFGYKFIKSFKPPQRIFDGMVNKVAKNPNKFFAIKENNYLRIRRKYKKFIVNKFKHWYKEYRK